MEIDGFVLFFFFFFIFFMFIRNRIFRLSVLYSHIINIHIYTHTCRIHIDAMKTSDTVLRKIYLSLYLKGFCVCERELETEQNCDILTPTLMVINVVSFSFSWCSTRGPGAQLSAKCWLSLPHLVTNVSGLQNSDFLSSPSYIIVQSPTQSLEWHVWSSSSGNNGHAVHRSLSTVHQSMTEPWDFTLSHIVSQACLRDFFP